MRIAYADPPYLGMCGRFYEHNHPDGKCWDDPETHFDLIDRLAIEFGDGWAMSLSVPSLVTLLPYATRMAADVRIAAWVKPFHVFKKGVRPAYAWEPVFFRGGRNENPPAPPKGGEQITPRDWRMAEADESPVVAANITLRRGLTGAKPERFCMWIFDLLNMRADDEFIDLFPGSGAVTRAWEKWQQQLDFAKAVS